MTERSTPQWARHSIYDGPWPTLRETGFCHAGSRRQLLHPHLPGCRPRARACRQLRALTVPLVYGWYGRRGGILKAVLGALLLVLVALYLYFFWNPALDRARGSAAGFSQNSADDHFQRRRIGLADAGASRDARLLYPAGTLEPG